MNIRPCLACLTTMILGALTGQSEGDPSMQIYQTSRAGDRLAVIAPVDPESDLQPSLNLILDPSRTYQEFIGVGGSFTESAAAVLYELSAERQAEILKACFSPEGAHYSLTRTHIASCDFSLRNYTYAPIAEDLELEHFSIEPDRTWLLPMIHAAQKVEGSEFRVMASPWTAPPWMKDNQTWNGGKLLEKYYQVFADYLVRYIEAYAAEGIPIWGITPINEPHGNNANWESTHFSPAEMANLIKGHIGPTFRDEGIDALIWTYDQNRGKSLIEWATTVLGDEEAAAFIAGTAVHWYDTTVHSHTDSLDTVAETFPDKQIIHSEGCIDAMGDDEPIGAWLEDDWYWRAEATDWGYIWASDEDKPKHPAYRPFHRYARDLIDGFNHHLSAWVDWNLLLNTRGGPNHARNYCLAPILVDSGRDHAYFTPLYYAMAHVSKFIRPGATRIHLSGAGNDCIATAFRNPNKSIAVVVFNQGMADQCYSLELPGAAAVTVNLPAQAMQTVTWVP